MAIAKAKSSNKTTYIDIPEAVGVFVPAQQPAFYDLRAVGFFQHDISLLGSQKALEEMLGKAYGCASEVKGAKSRTRGEQLAALKAVSKANHLT